MIKKISIASAREFVSGADIPAPRRSRSAAAPTTQVAFDSAKTQAAVIGSAVVSFVNGVSAERRDAIVDSSLLAQLVAKQKVPEPDRIYDWYEAYFDVLTNVGWVVQEKGFAEYKEASKDFDAHKAILAVATTLLGPAPAALAIVKSTIDALESMNESSPWIRIFNKETQSARAARFQIGLAEQDANGEFFVNLLAFGLEAKSSVTQVLFFKARSTEAKLQHYSGRVTINTGVLDGIRAEIKKKLLGHANNFVSQLPDLG
ncbi:MAG: hypothetical protein ACT4P7_19615 [Gemmatimonadaceae bacterium]